MKKLLIFILFLLSVSFIRGAIKLPVIFSDGLVLQRDTKFTINGWASPGEKVTLNFNGKKYSARTK